MEKVIFSNANNILTSTQFILPSGSATTIANNPQTYELYAGFIGISGITALSATTDVSWLNGSFTVEEVYTIKVMKLTGTVDHNRSGASRVGHVSITARIDGVLTTPVYTVTQTANISNFND